MSAIDEAEDCEDRPEARTVSRELSLSLSSLGTKLSFIYSDFGAGREEATS